MARITCACLHRVPRALVIVFVAAVCLLSSSSCWLSAGRTVPSSHKACSGNHCHDGLALAADSYHVVSSRLDLHADNGWRLCVRGLLAAMAVIAVAAFGSPKQAWAQNVDVYFGQGCFWHVQHMLATHEVDALSRGAKDLTAISGYAGGSPGPGGEGQVCYHNRQGAPDYGQLGHAEVVNLSIPEESVSDFAKVYFDSAAKSPFGRDDPQDIGGEYRSAIGLPGGVDSPLFAQVKAANADRVKLIAGDGGDPDTLFKNVVYVYDSKNFPFIQGEVYHQFHDDMREKYSEQYHRLKGVFKYAGKLHAVECPDEKV